MNAQNRYLASHGAILAVVAALFVAGVAQAQTLGPPTLPPPKLVRPEPMKIPDVVKPEAQAPPQAEAEPEAAPAPRLKATDGPWRQKKVTLDLKDATLAEALANTAKQAGIGIAIAAASASSNRITLSVTRKNAEEVIDLLLELGSLNGELRGDILYVTAPAVAVASVATAPQRSTDEPDLQVKGPGFGVSVHMAPEDSDEPRHGKRHGPNWDRHKKAERVQALQPVRVEAGETVDGAVSIGDDVTVVGHVRGDAVSIGGNVLVEPTGVVDGDAVSVGGSLQIQPGGQVKGEQVGIGLPFFGKNKDDKKESSAPLWLLPGIAGAFTVFGILGALLRTAVIILAALLALWLAPRRVEAVRGYLAQNPGFSFGGGLLLFSLGIPLIVILALTLVGIPIALLVVAAVFACAVLGMASLLVWLGQRIPFMRDKSEVLALLVGALILGLLSTIPFLGCALQVLVTLAAAGAALLTRFGSRPESAPHI